MQDRGLFNIFLSLRPLLALTVLYTLPLQALTLEEAVFQTLQSNPEVKEKRYNLESIEQDRDLARSGYYPKINLYAGKGVAKDEITPAYSAQTGEEVTRRDSGVSLSWNLFSGFYTYHDSDARAYKSQAAQSYLNEYEASVAMKTLESYINMIKHKAILQISRENVFSHKEIYNKLKEKSNSGMGKASDLGFASGRLTLAEVNAVVHENNFIQSKVLFETLFGRPIDANSLTEPVFDYTLPKTLEDAALIAMDNNPAIQTGKFNIKSAKSNYKRSQSVYYPSLDLEIKGSWLDETDGYEYSVDSSYAMLYLSYNLFNGFADKAMVEKDFAAYMQNSQYLNITKRDVVNRLGTSWIATIKIDRQLQLLKKMRDFSKKTLQDYYAEFGIGKRTLLDIINVRNDYNNARQSYEAAKYDLMLSKFRTLDAIGGLVDYFKAKADALKLQSEKEYVEDKSVYEIIRQMDRKLQSKEPFVDYDESNFTSLDQLGDDKDALDFGE